MGITWYQFKDAVELLAKLPKEDLDVLLAKPSSYDRLADQAWRRMCRKWGISNAARAITADQAAYDACRSAEVKAGRLQVELHEAQTELSKYRTAAALTKVLNRG